MSVPYAELHCFTNFCFQRGASHAEELVARARRLGYAALAITDECSVAGVVRAQTNVDNSGEAQRKGTAVLPERLTVTDSSIVLGVKPRPARPERPNLPPEVQALIDKMKQEEQEHGTGPQAEK